MWITSSSELMRLRTERLAPSWHILRGAMHVPTCMPLRLPWRPGCAAEPSPPPRSCRDGSCPPRESGAHTASIPTRPGFAPLGTRPWHWLRASPDGKPPSAVEATAVFPGGKGNQRAILSHALGARPWIRSDVWWPWQLFQPQPLQFSRQQQVLSHRRAAEEKPSIQRR